MAKIQSSVEAKGKLVLNEEKIMRKKKEAEAHQR